MPDWGSRGPEGGSHHRTFRCGKPPIPSHEEGGGGGSCRCWAPSLPMGGYPYLFDYDPISRPSHPITHKTLKPYCPRTLKPREGAASSRRWRYWSPARCPRLPPNRSQVAVGEVFHVRWFEGFRMSTCRIGPTAAGLPSPCRVRQRRGGADATR